MQYLFIETLRFYDDTFVNNISTAKVGRIFTKAETFLLRVEVSRSTDYAVVHENAPRKIPHESNHSTRAATHTTTMFPWTAQVPSFCRRTQSRQENPLPSRNSLAGQKIPLMRLLGSDRWASIVSMLLRRVAIEKSANPDADRGCRRRGGTVAEKYTDNDRRSSDDREDWWKRKRDCDDRP